MAIPATAPTKTGLIEVTGFELAYDTLDGAVVAVSDADLVVITAGVAQQPGQSRLELIERNAALFRQLVPPIALHCPRAVLLVV